MFGKNLKDIRKSLNLTQKEVADLAYIDPVTLRRIENGKVIPKLETLELLSPIYKQDLIDLLIKYRFDDYLAFYEIKKRIESKIDNGELNNLQVEVKGLKILLSTIKNTYCKKLVTQLLFFIEAIILYYNNSNEEALDKLIESIKITTPSFKINKYNSFVYSSMEIRILMNIAFIFNKLNHQEKYIEILEFCINTLNNDDEIYPKLCHNLAGAYIRNKDFKKALYFSNIGIESCQKNRNLNGLSLLFYGKGIAEYRLGKKENIDSLKTSIYLCKAFRQDQLEIAIRNNCKEFLDITL